MMYAIIFVLDDPDRLDAVLDAWRDVGVGGITIIESSGIHRRKTRGKRIPMRFGFEQLAERLERDNYTLFALVDDESAVQRCLEAAEAVVGNLQGPNTGVLAAWPVPIIGGLPKRRGESGERS